MRTHLILLIILMSFTTSGCEARDADAIAVESKTGEVEGLVTGAKPSAAFQEGLQSSRSFTEAYKEGKKYLESDPELAIKHLERALEIADNRAFQSMALEKMAIAYEKLGQNQIAANFWEESAKASMNSTMKEEYLARAEKLRQQ